MNLNRDMIYRRARMLQTEIYNQHGKPFALIRCLIFTAKCYGFASWTALHYELLKQERFNVT